jgi:hypothetical protein
MHTFHIPGFFLSVLLLILSAMPCGSHGTTAGDRPLTTGTLRLQHLKAAEIVALFAREQPLEPGGRILRAARAGCHESLLPAGIDALMRAGTEEIAFVGSEDRFQVLADCIRLLDVPAERIGPNREKIVLTLRQANARQLRSRMLRLPGAGSVVLNGRQLVLAGTSVWLHGALRQVIAAELDPNPEPPGPGTL